MEKGIKSVQVDFGTWHRPNRRQQFVLLPFSLRPDDHDFVTNEFAGSIIMFPVFRDKDFEERAGTKTHPRRPGEPDQMLGQIVWNQFRVPGF